MPEYKLHFFNKWFYDAQLYDNGESFMIWLIIIREIKRIRLILSTKMAIFRDVLRVDDGASQLKGQT